MINDSKVTKILYGGDYNPEQWTPEEWQEDMRLFQLAGIDVVTLNVFNWATLQRDEETYDFSALDITVKRVTEHNISICMATSTGAMPAWMARKYPDILRTNFEGMRMKFGGRHNACPNSPTYRKYSVLLAEKLAKHYKYQKNIVAWHINNEYGGMCYCENCEKAFRVWLKKKYRTLEALNHEWNTAFWGHTFYDWEEIVVPNKLSEHFEENRTTCQGISLDYKRFMSDSLLENYQLEYAAIKEHMREVKITTNMMGLYKGLDYHKWAKYVDFVSWDNYPNSSDTMSQVALNHAAMRGLKDGMPFCLMEQTPSVSNWLPDNRVKAPGVMRLWSYQAVANGADTVMFFQMRRSPGGCEKFHGAVIDHCGHENTRVFRELTQLGEELKGLGNKILGSRISAEAAILFDWDNWWAIEYSAGPNNRLRYVDEIRRYYTALHDSNIMTDVISVEADFSRYKVIVAPVHYMLKPGVDEKLRAFVKNGGTLVTSFFSGIVNENDRILPGGYPGKLRDILGIWVEEMDVLPPELHNSFIYHNISYEARMWCDLLHTEGAEALSSYETDFYQGMPVITRNSFGEGRAYYVATVSTEDFYTAFLSEVCKEAHVEPVLPVLPNVEVTKRSGADKEYLFLLNHGKDTVQIPEVPEGRNLLTGKIHSGKETLELPGNDVAILEISKK